MDNTPLEGAMKAVAAADSPGNRRRLYAAMLETSFLVPTEAAAGGRGSGAPIVVCAAGEQQVAVAFTHEDALRSWDENVPWIVLQGAELFKKALEAQADEIVINPFEPAKQIGLVRPGGRVKHWEIEALSAGVSPQDQINEPAGGIAQSEPQQVLLSTPTQMPPREFFDALSGAARKHPVVLALYFCRSTRPDGQSRREIAVGFSHAASSKAKDSAMAAFGEALGPLLGEDEVAGFFGTSTEMGKEIARLGTCFYRSSSERSEGPG